MKTCVIVLCVLAVCVTAFLPGCGSASTAERMLDDIDAQRASIAADRNKLLLALLHDKSVYATRDVVSQARLSLRAAARNGQVDLATVDRQLDGLATEVNLAAQVRAINRGQVETLNIAEERTKAMELGLRIQIEAAKGIFGRSWEALQAWQAAQRAKTATAPAESPVIVWPATQPGG